MEGTKRRLSDIEREIHDMLEVEPHAVAALAEDRAGRRTAAARRDRGKPRKAASRPRTPGAVNLRAEEELREVETQHTALTTERDDLVEAIKRLRQGIQSLNKEARERLLTSFETVNAHFKRLDLEHVVDLPLDIGKTSPRSFDALLRAGGGLARARQRFQRRLRFAVGLRHHGLGGGERVGSDAAVALGVLDLGDQRAALLGEHRRGVLQLGALPATSVIRCLDGRDLEAALCLRFCHSVRSAVIACTRLSASSARAPVPALRPAPARPSGDGRQSRCERRQAASPVSRLGGNSASAVAAA